jgi:hypothetical protein
VVPVIGAATADEAEGDVEVAAEVEEAAEPAAIEVAEAFVVSATGWRGPPPHASANETAIVSHERRPEWRRRFLTRSMV